MSTAAYIEQTEPEMVGKRIVALREAVGGIDSKVLAALIGLDPSSLTKVEKGKATLRPQYALKIYELYGVDMNFLYLGRLDGMPPSISSALTKALTNLD